MAPNSAAMELKVLISVLQQGTALSGMLNQVNQLSSALSKLQTQAGAGAPILPGAGGLPQIPAAANAANAAVENLGRTVNKVIDAVKFLAGGFLALESVRFLKSIADVAARTETLNTVLHVVALNAGYTTEQIDNASKAVQRLGITAQSANESLTRFLQAGLKLEFAQPLARAAQDLAVVSGMDSSATFGRLLLNIQQLDTMGLRHMGIIVSRTEAETKYAATVNKSVSALSQRERQEALMAGVIEKARSLEGAYEAAMGNVGKQITSLTRYMQDLRSEVGKFLLPAYSALVSELTLFLSKMQDLAVESTTNLDAARELGETVRYLARQFFIAVEFIIEHRRALILLTEAYLAYWAMVTGKMLWAHLTSVVVGLTNAVLTSAEAIVRATRVTYAWIVALRLLNATRAAGTAQAAGQLSFDFMKEGASVGLIARLKDLWTWLGSTAVRGGLLSRAMLLLESIFGGITLAAVGMAATIAAVAASFALLATHTDIGPEGWKSLSLLKDIVVDLAGLLTGDFILGWREFQEVIRDFAISDFSKALEESGKRLAAMPGSGLYEVIETMKFFNNILGATSDKLREMREETERLNALRKGPVTDEESKSLQENLASLRAQLGAAKEATETARNAYTRSIATSGKFSDESKAAEAEFLRLKRLEDELVRRRDKALESTRRRDPMAAAREEAQAKLNAAKNEADKVISQATDAVEKLTKTRVTFGTNGELIITSKDFAEKISQLQQLYDALEKLDQKARQFQPIQLTPAQAERGGPQRQISPGAAERNARQDELADIRRDQAKGVADALEGLKVISVGVKTLEDLRQFREKVNQELYRFDADQKKVIERLLDNAQIRSREGERDLFSPREQIRVAQFKAGVTLRQAELQNELDLAKARNAQVAALDKERYDKGLTTTQEFFFMRRQIATKEYDIQLRQATQAVLDAEAEIREGINFSIPEQIAAQTRLEGAQRAREKVVAERPGQVTALDVEERAAVTERTRKLTDAVLANAVAYGSEAAAIDQVNEAYTRRLEQLGPGARSLEIADQERLISLAKIWNELGERNLQLTLESRRVDRERIEIERATLDAARDRIQKQEGAGVLTDVEARNQRNALILRQRDIDQNDLVQKRLDLRTKLDEIERKTGDIILQQQAGGFKPESVETAEALRKGLSGLVGEAQALQVQIISLDGAVQTATLNTESYGKELREFFVDSFADALTQTTMNFKNAGKIWLDLSRSLASQIIGIFAKAFSERLFKQMGIFQMADQLANFAFGLGGGGGGGGGATMPASVSAGHAAEGGLISGPGTGTSDSVPIMASTGEHIMPAAKAAQFLPLLEGIRTGKILPFRAGGVVQSIAISPVIPRRYAAGGVVVSDAGAASVQTGNSAPGNMVVTMHPETLNMTMREWLEHEVVRQNGRR